jgi:hypothetical protein
MAQRLLLLLFSTYSLNAAIAEQPATPAPEENAPTFADHSVYVSQGTLKRIDFASHESGEYMQDRLDYHIGEPVNFAGNYRLAVVGCGTMCQSLVAIQVSTGKIVDTVTSSLGACFQPDSQLLVLNPDLASNFEGEIPGWATTSYYRITPFGFKLLHSTKASYTGPCPTGE